MLGNIWSYASSTSDHPVCGLQNTVLIFVHFRYFVLTSPLKIEEFFDCVLDHSCLVFFVSLCQNRSLGSLLHAINFLSQRAGQFDILPRRMFARVNH